MNILSHGQIRLAIVLSVSWLLIALTLYASSLNSYDDPYWIIIWSNIFPFFSVASPFSRICDSQGAHSLAEWFATPCLNEFSMLGLVAFCAYPIALIWLSVLAFSWVRQGFLSDPKRNREGRKSS